MRGARERGVAAGDEGRAGVGAEGRHDVGDARGGRGAVVGFEMPDLRGRRRVERRERDRLHREAPRSAHDPAPASLPA